MSQRTLAPAVSNWVTGDKFFDRVDETAALREDLEAGTHILMSGQRRMGKTSIAREVGRRLSSQQDPWHFLFVDADGCEDESHLISLLAGEVATHDRQNKKVRSWAKALFGATRKISEIAVGELSLSIRNSMTSGSWQNHGDELLRSLAGERPCLLVIDELPNLLMKIERTKGKDGVENLLRWLRRALQSGDIGGLRVVISGSIGLTPLVKRLGLANTISPFEEFRIGPWSREIAVACLDARARYDYIQYGDGAQDWIVAKLGLLVPYHIQRVAKKAADRLRNRDDKTVSLDDLRSIYEDMINGGEFQLQHYRSRLNEALGDDLALHAQRLLSACTDGQTLGRTSCHSNLGQSFTMDDVNWLLDVLTHDGYLLHANGKWHFPLGILRDWWSTTYPSDQT